MSPGGRLYTYTTNQREKMDETNGDKYVVVTHINLNKQGIANSDLALYIQLEGHPGVAPGWVSQMNGHWPGEEKRNTM